MIELLKKRPITHYMFAILFLVRFLFPGDASFIQDEANFLKMAESASANGVFYQLGFLGTKGIKYGPGAIWFFRILNFISTDLIIASIVYNLVLTSCSLFGIYLVAKTLTLRSFGAFLFLLSPFLWFYSRNMWDNSLNIPLGFIAFGFYTRFLKEERKLDLLVTALSLNLMLLIHLMTVPIAVAFLIHLLFFKRAYLFKNWWFTLLILTIIATLSGPYVIYLLKVEVNNVTMEGKILRGFVFPLFSSRFFSTFDFSYFLGKGWEGNLFLKSFTILTWTSFPLFWYGIYLAISRVIKEKSLDLMSQVLVLVLLVLAFYMIFSAFTSIHTHPHYQSPIIFMTLFLVWFALENIFKFKHGAPLVYSYHSLHFVILLLIIYFVHKNEGSKSLHYGHALSDQISVAKKLNEYSSDTNIIFKTFHTETFSPTLDFIRNRYPNNDIKKRAKEIRVEYLDPDDTYNAKMKVLTIP